MVIEIRGAQLVNKGAELMLLAILQELKHRINTDVKFAVEPHKNMPYERRVELGLYAIPRFRKYRVKWGTPFNYLPSSIRRQIGFVAESELHAIIDISGFRYGDFWGVRNLVGGLTGYLKNWKKQGIKVLLLPQAFGPFEGNRINKEMSKALESVDFIAARDLISYNYLKEIETKNSKNNIHLYPDFTPSILPSGNRIKKYENHIFIIPNTKMNVDGSYKTYLHKLATYLDNTNKQFSFLIHEGKDDYELAKEIVIESKIKVNIIWESDPLLIKCLIKSSKFIITSRYHGLINGLSQGIPSLSTSWSHKYETLLAEYEFTSGLISDLSDFSNTIEKINMIEDNYVEIKKGIEKKSVIHKNKLDDMWNKVVNIINH